MTSSNKLGAAVLLLSLLLIGLATVVSAESGKGGVGDEAFADQPFAITAPLTLIPGLYVKNGGFVGVGTDNPAVALHVNAVTAPGAPVVRLQNQGGVRFEFRDDTNNVQWDFRTTSGNTFTIARLLPVPANMMTVLSNGDLRIAGSLKTQNGANTYPDYVFEPGYTLMPLDELASFIDREKHLPDVLTTKDVQQEGELDMTKLQIQLLRKVEELTLYTLQQQEYIELLESRLGKLEAAGTVGSGSH